MRIGLLSDIHEDLQSLKQALRQLEKRNCNELACLGDIVGFDRSACDEGVTRDPSGCVAAVRANCRYAVVGNHDLFAMKKIPKSTHAFRFPPDWYKLTLHERRLHSHGQVWLYETENTSPQLRRNEKKYLDSLPEHLVIKCRNHHIYLSHSLHPDLTGSLMLHPHNPWELREHLQILRIGGCSYGFSGHMHLNGVLIGREHDIREAPFGELALDKDLAQYSCPGIADNGNRRGYTVVDFTNMTLETCRLAARRKKRNTWYERILKKN